MKGKLWPLAGVMVMAAVGLGVYLGFDALTDGTASAAPDPVTIDVSYSYAVEFYCGRIHGGPELWGGASVTTIRVHNPQNTDVTFAKKAVVLKDVVPESSPDGPLGPTPTPGPPPHGEGPPPVQFPVEPGPRVLETLGPDGALGINCTDIALTLGAPVFGSPGGFVVIESPDELDVVARYTATRVDNTKNIACLYKDGRVIDWMLPLPAPSTPGLTPTLIPPGTPVPLPKPIVPQCPVVEWVEGAGRWVRLPALVGIGVGQGVGSGVSVDVERVEPTSVSYTIIVEE